MRRLPGHSFRTKTNDIMGHYADSSNRAASGKNNQPSYAIHYVETSRIRKATKGRPTNQTLTILKAYKRLSCRECEVLEKIAEGMTSHGIAYELIISSKIVENPITNISKKLKGEPR